MKRNLFLLLTLVLSIACGSAAQAVPMYYTFEGTVIGSSEDGAGAYAAAGITSGTPVSYVLVVDYDAAGTWTYNDGTQYTYPASNDTSLYHFVNFYDDYYSGGLLDEVNGGSFNATGHTYDALAEYNRGYDRTGLTDATNKTGVLNAGSGDDSVEISSANLYVWEWAVGSSLQGIESVYGPQFQRSSFYSSLTLTGISDSPGNDTAAVPEPGTVLLLGTGLVGLFGVGRKFRT